MWQKYFDKPKRDVHIKFKEYVTNVNYDDRKPLSGLMKYVLTLNKRYETMKEIQINMLHGIYPKMK